MVLYTIRKSRAGLRAITALFACLVGCAAAPAFSQSLRPPSDDELAVRAEDPTAPLMSFEVNDWYQASLYDKDGTINQAMFRSVIPFTVGSVDHLFRFTQQYTTEAYNHKLGGSDPEVIYLAGTGVPWGRWGIGAVLEPPTGSNSLTSDKWSMGPSAGAVNTQDPNQRWGAFLRTYASFAGSEHAKKVSMINLQPIYDLKLGGGRSLSLGETEAVYDAATSKWKTLQVGLKIGQLFRLVDLKWKSTAEADYDFKDTSGNARWTLRVGIVMLLPGLE